jgi:peptidoglycan L-alanyl-D-glutamate endopeptidase CwlK
MRDKITLDRIELMHPKERANCLAMYNEMCEAVKGKALVRFAYTLRTWAEQDALYALGRTVKNSDGYHPTKKPLGNIVTWARGGESFHNYALAWDLVIVLDQDGNGSYEKASWDMKIDLDGDGISDWREIVEIAIKYGYECGCNWNKPKTDNPHFQKTFGHSIMDLKAMFLAKKFIPNTNYVAI